MIAQNQPNLGFSFSDLFGSVVEKAGSLISTVISPTNVQGAIDKLILGGATPRPTTTVAPRTATPGTPGYSPGLFDQLGPILPYLAIGAAAIFIVPKLLKRGRR